MTIGERIAKMRNEAGLSQAELARLLNIESVSVSRWETNKTKPDRHLLNLAKALKVRPDWIIHGDSSDTVDLAESASVPIDNLSPEGIRRRLGNLPIRVIEIAFQLERFNDSNFMKVKKIIDEIEIDAANRPKTRPLKDKNDAWR